MITGIGRGLRRRAAAERESSRGRRGRSSIGPIRGWDAPLAGDAAAEIADFDPRALVRDRKLLKLIRRTDVFGIYAAARRSSNPASCASARCARRGGRRAQRSHRPLRRVRRRATRTSTTTSRCSRGAGRPADVRPRAERDREPDVAAAFAAEQRAVPRRHHVRPEGPERLHHQPQRQRHAGDRRGAEALRTGEADARRGRSRRADRAADRALLPRRRACRTRCGAPVRRRARRQPDRRRRRRARPRNRAFGGRARRRVLGEVLGGGCATEGEGLLPIRDDGDGVVARDRAALDDADIDAARSGWSSRTATARAPRTRRRRVRQIDLRVWMPPITALKWSIGHLLAGAGSIDAVLALQRSGAASSRYRRLEALDPECSICRCRRRHPAATSRSSSRGFGGTNAALVVRGPSMTQSESRSSRSRSGTRPTALWRIAAASTASNWRGSSASSTRPRRRMCSASFRQQELADAGTGAGRVASLAARFAAKEACLSFSRRDRAPSHTG